MYNYNNNQKSNVSTRKKMAGPNADRVNPYMAPGAYQQTPSMVKKTPDWMGAAAGYGDRMTSQYKDMAAKPYMDAMKMRQQQEMDARAAAANPPPVASQAMPTRGATQGASMGAPMDIAAIYGGSTLTPTGSGMGVPAGVPRTGVEGYYGYIPPAGQAGSEAIEASRDYQRRVRAANIAKGMPELGVQPPLGRSDVSRAPEARGLPPVSDNEFLQRYLGPQEINVAPPDTGSPPRPQERQQLNVARPMDGSAPRPRTEEETAVAGAPPYPASSWQAAVAAMSNPTQYTLEEEMARGIAPDSLGTKAMRGAIQQMPYEQLVAAAQAAGVAVPPSSISPEQIAQLEAQTAAQIAKAGDSVSQAQRNAEDIAAQYAPRTRGSLSETPTYLENRNVRAESALRGELGPRSPGIDPSGPYSRDAQGKLYDGRVNSTYSISGAQAERDAQKLAEMQADGDAYRARRDERDAEMKNRPEKPITNPTQMKRDAQQFSADYQIYKRGGGTLSTRDYILQRARAGELSNDLTKQLEYNYGMDLSPSKLESVKPVDVSSQRDKAMADAQAGRDAEDSRRASARGAINAEAARRGAMDRQVAADRNAGYYDTRPMREAQRTQQENINRAMEYDKSKQATALAGKKELIEARANAEAQAYQRQMDMQAQSEYSSWANATQADIRSSGYQGEISDPNSEAGMEWQRRQSAYTGRRPSQQPGATAPPATSPGAVDSNPQAAASKLKLDIKNGVVPIDFNAPPLAQATSLAGAAAARNMSPEETINFIKSEPNGLDFSKPDVARAQLNEIKQKMLENARAVGGTGGYSEAYAGGVGNRYIAGAKEITDQYEPVLRLLRKTLGEKEVARIIDQPDAKDAVIYNMPGMPGMVARSVLGE
jgi:hypothetical protein